MADIFVWQIDPEGLRKCKMLTVIIKVAIQVTLLAGNAGAGPAAGAAGLTAKAPWALGVDMLANVANNIGHPLPDRLQDLTRLIGPGCLP